MEKLLIKVNGKRIRKIILFALSTCIWCRKTKNLLNEIGVEYEYVDMDLLDNESKKELIEILKKWNPELSFPTLVIDNTTCVIGYKEEEIKKELGL